MSAGRLAEGGCRGSARAASGSESTRARSSIGRSRVPRIRGGSGNSGTVNMRGLRGIRPDGRKNGSVGHCNARRPARKSGAEKDLAKVGGKTFYLLCRPLTDKIRAERERNRMTRTGLEMGRRSGSRILSVGRAQGIGR